MPIIGEAQVVVTPITDKFGKTVGYDIQKQLGQAGGAMGKFGGVVDSLSNKVKGLGITSADVAIVMGAGLAGGAAFAAREVIQFVGASIEASSALHEQEAATRQVFEANSEMVESFAESAAGMGLSERAALQASNVFGGFFQNIGLGTEASAKLATGFTSLAAELGSFFDEAPEAVIQRLISGLRGEQEAVERLNVNISEGIVLQRAIKEGFGDTAAEVSLGERVFARALIILEQTSKAHGDLARNVDSLAASQRRANAEYENAKAAFGDALQPIATFVTDTGADFLNMLRGLDDGFQRFNDGAEEATKQVTLLGFGFRTMIEGRETNALEKLRDILFGFEGDEEDATDTTKELAGAFAALADEENRLAVATDKVTDATERQENARTRLNRAIGDAERRVDRAETNLARAFEDAELRVDAAERGLAEAFEDRAERIADAEGRLVKARLQGFRDVRAARERLSDFDAESTRREIDIQEELLDLRREQARAILEAEVSVRDAQLSGDADAENRARRELTRARDSSDIHEAEQEAEQEAIDRARERDRLERDLAEARQDREREIREAELDLAQTIEDAADRIAEAQRRVEDAHRDSARSIEDAQRGLADAFRDGREAVDDAIGNMENYQQELEETRTGVQLLNKDLREMNLLMDPGNANEPGITVEPDGSISIHGDGGLAHAGRAAIVGDRGPELIIPSTNSTVVSNDQLLEVLRQMSTGRSGGGTVLNFNVPHQDPRVLANEVQYRLAEALY